MENNYISVKPQDALWKNEVYAQLKCNHKTLKKITELYNIKLDKTITGKNEYITKENFLIIKEKLEEYRNKPKEQKSYNKKGMTINDIAKQIGESVFVVTKVLKTNTIPHIAEDLRSKYYDEYVLETIKEKAQEYKNRKQNYLDKMEIAKLFGYNPKDMGAANTCFQRIKQKWGKPPSKPIQIPCGDTWPNYANRACYPKEETLKWIEEIKSTKKWQQRTPGNVLTQEERDRREKEKREKERLFQEQTKNRIKTEQAIAILGTKSTSPLTRNLDKLPGTIKIKNKFYYLKEEVQKLKLYLEKEKREQQKQSIKKREKRNPRLKKDWTASSVYEDRAWKQIQKGKPEWTTAQLNRAKKEILDQRWLNNKRLMKNGKLGLIKYLDCYVCKEELPYTDFYIEYVRGNNWGREGRCKACMKKSKEGKEKIKKPKTASKFALQFIMSIRNELSRQNGYYVEIPGKEIWEGVEKYCGYTKEQFIENIESKLAPWMTWENNKRSTVPGEQTWQLDHITPRADFKYTKMSDPEFALCWALSNLNPLEAQINLLKSNKKFTNSIRSCFIRGLRTGKPVGVLWQHLDYDPMEARQYLEKNWGERIDWENFKNTNLEIDHIIPQAFLAFTSFSDENFRECWSLRNLQILTKKDNISKSSVHNNILWGYNYE